ncbi:atrial natriuretic peptide receptor 2-like, partial [Saccoglossus kowalevskii]|uniref:guanylate cyclase n=1 Tax=Saccoglossus kowalevskii TaxID=10224 RepID=A0ABM0LU41_SACKO
MVTVAKYYGKRKLYEPVPGVEIEWPSGTVTAPLDTPICGFQGELCIEKGWRYKLQKEIAEMLWKISSEDIIFEEKNFLSGASKISIPSRIDASDEQVFAKIGIYRGSRYALKPIESQKMTLNKSILFELKQLREINHSNLTRFVGACVDPSSSCLVIEYCPKGSLQDILENESIKLDWMFRYSLIFDIVKGMEFIHNSSMKTHANLKSSNCLVDSRFVLKVTDFGLHEWKDAIVDFKSAVTHSEYYTLLWRSPELLRHPITRGSQKGDVYSFGIILQEIITRTGPFDHELGDDCMAPQ